MRVFTYVDDSDDEDVIETPQSVPNTEDQRYDFYIKEIENVGGVVTVAPILKAIYDGDDHAKFLERLEARIEDHSGTIQKMCNFHYQGFIDSINELLQVKGQAAKLKAEVIQANKELIESTNKALEKGEALCKIRRTQCNIKAAIEALSVCLPVLEMFSKLTDQMKDKRYYPALKTIELLEHTYLPLIKKHKFASTMEQRLPQFRKQIEDASMTELKDFLESIRKYSARIGELAITQAHEQYKLETEILFASNVPGSSQQTKRRRDIDTDAAPAQDIVDFSPVYRCYHIFTVLGLGDKFQEYYKKSREDQSKLALQPAHNMLTTLEGCRQYFNEVVGFFVVEEHIANTAGNLVSQTDLDISWESALTKVAAELRTSTGNSTEAPRILKMKTLIMLFAYTMKSYGFKSDPLIGLLMQIYEHYNEILMKTCRDSFRQLFEEDTYHPMQVDTEEDYRRILSKFPFRDEVLERSPFPRKFPFSSFVPGVYTHVKEFIGESLKFLQDLNLSQSVIEEEVRKSTNLLLTRTLSGCLTALIKKPSLGLLQLIQITINTNYLEDASCFLEEFISSIFKSSSNKHHVSELRGKAMFKDSRKDAEDQIYEQIKRKIDESIELATYDWLATEARGTASPYMLDLIAFLHNVFQAFTNLPVRYDVAEFKDKVAQTACMTACQHLSKKLLDLLRNDEVKSISMGAVEQFNLDLMQCEQFANSEPVHGLNDQDALPLFFVELRQLVELVMEEDWASYVQDYGKNNATYLRVNAMTALIILEKVCAADKKRNILTNFNQRQKERKKLQESAMKQLRALTQTNGISINNHNVI